MSLPVLKRGLPSSPKKINQYKSCYDLVDKLYAVSPKNTFHLETASATVMTRNDIPEDDDDDDDDDNYGEVSEFYGPVLSTPSPSSSPFTETSQVYNDLDNISVHTTDTHYDGGGGGGLGFEYKFPNGGKIKLGMGGGGGFDYDHRNSTGKRSSSSGKSFSKKSSRMLCEDTTKAKGWFSWMTPTSRKQNSVRKKLSKFTFKGQSDDASIHSGLLSGPPTLGYSSIGDPEAGNCTQPSLNDRIVITKQDFTNYVFISLGIDQFKIDYDPIFERYGKQLIRDLSVFEVLLCYLDSFIWVMGTLLVYTSEFLQNSRDYIVTVMLLSLINVNLLNNSNFHLRNILLSKIILNGVILSILTVL
ncbi:hypothetical protein CANTEDRAFT_112420 [Yamadazyma tenuis ATCC 10573]|uniref:Uncharacterized protein n=2 Tax=Candida tenuis TaxID=2315449 RepID=G3AX34_CANTC|nr:uncharacterized protein CANTEDRAFT_112420 [Yamadazyma tenuis ATCC 10573]EGV66679.1 hypothetical protein CANTEDRAFT_112420 [Yamadazyma tenuis ATCC 10573]